MKITSLHYAFVMVILIAVGSWADSKSRITQIVGKVQVRIAGNASWRDARIDMPVREKHDIRTYLESEAEITLESGTKLKIGENSVVTLARLLSDSSTGSSKSTVKVGTGTIWANVKKLTDTRSEFDFETPTAVASIRGTRLGIDVGKKSTRIDVYEGLVAVRHKGAKKTVNVSANTRAIVEEGKKSVTVLDFRKVIEKSGAEKKDLPFDPYQEDVNAPEIPDKLPEEGTEKREDSTESTAPAVEEQLLPPESEHTPVSDQRIALTITSPAEGTEITEPLITVAGKAVPGANVFVNEQQVAIRSDGSFSHRLPLPDEPYTYSVEVRAEYNGTELVKTRSVTYTALQEKLSLICSSPADGAVIKGKTIRLAGKTAPKAQVTANGKPVRVSATGVFSQEIAVAEKDIGEYQLEVAAKDGSSEIVKTFSLELSSASPQINTSAPVVVFGYAGTQAVTQHFMPIQLLDRTPDDELTVNIMNNGSSDILTSSNGRTEKILLDEGKNSYVIKVSDRGGNAAPVIRGEVYYLPGPLKIILNAPSSNREVFEGLPPMINPGHKRIEEPFDVEVEIDDGIGTVAESIRYCKVTGMGQNVVLRNNNDYIYSGKVNVGRGTNAFTVQVEDLSGRLETERFTIEVK